ncbi:MAG: hypothetical protein JO166_06245 [Deltaproteobacteria bacterium]|nr:hypothetical protein [Deltaproteobacteria bacterium]
MKNRLSWSLAALTTIVLVTILTIFAARAATRDIMQSLSSISFSVRNRDIGRNRKMRVVVSIASPPGWRMVFQSGTELIYERIAPGTDADSVNFEIRAFTTVEPANR